MHYLLIYELSPDYLERRGQFRNDHLKLAQAAEERGEIMMGGALADPADRAFLVFKADTPAPAEAFARADPYVKNGLVKHWQVRAWTTVVGPLAATPVKPT
jgi:uncharacterized protein YciI